MATELIEQPEHSAGIARVREAMEGLKLIRTFIEGELVDGTDYGLIPGTDKKTLLLPGAQKVAMYFNASPRYTIQPHELESGHVEYVITATLFSRSTGEEVAAGVGSCTTMEGKYRYRMSSAKCPKCGKENTIIKGKEEYGGGWVCFEKKGGCKAKFADNAPVITEQPRGQIDNPNIWDTRNTVLKMAKKRAQVDAAMGLGCLSEFFTQDIEDFYDLKGEKTPTQPKPAENAPVAESAPEKPPEEPIDLDIRRLIKQVAEETHEQPATVVSWVRDYVGVPKGQMLQAATAEQKQAAIEALTERLPVGANA